MIRARIRRPRPGWSAWRPRRRPRCPRPHARDAGHAPVGKRGCADSLGRAAARPPAGSPTAPRREAERSNARIELIDGARLAELLVAHEVGVEGVKRHRSTALPGLPPIFKPPCGASLRREGSKRMSSGAEHPKVRYGRC